MKLKYGHIIFVVFIVQFFSCNTKNEIPQIDECDSLNMSAYHMRYQSIAKTESLANAALHCSKPNTYGRADAIGNLAFVKYMKMDYDSAMILYKKSYEESKDIHSKMMADIGMMKICHIVSNSKEFYDYEIDADKYNQKVLEENLSSLSEWDKLKRNYCISEFCFAKASFYNDAMQDLEARENLRFISSNQSYLQNDTAQLARFYQLCSSMGRGRLDATTKIRDLSTAYVISKQNNLIYHQACALQKISDYITRNPESNVLGPFVPFFDVSDKSNDEIGLSLANTSLELYKEYGSIYSRALAYLTISENYLRQGNFQVALDTALLALNYSEQYKDAKEWRAKIHEQLSIIYSFLGNKAGSDENRNVYLDILEDTRQDKFLKQRSEQLEHDQDILSWIMISLSALIVIFIIGGVIYFVLIRKRIMQSRKEEFVLSEKEKMLLTQRFEQNKRRYIDKCTSLSIVEGIRPFLSRAIRCLKDVSESNSENTSEKLKYATELYQKIEEYNTNLAHWIKVRQGEVSLEVESFSLRPLFETLMKSNNLFVDKNVSLRILQSDSIVKADKSLTLFMINTLLDNARKYTPSGGSVELNAVEADNYVEISVSDTGYGMNEDDINTILTEKVYDSSTIGCSENNEELKSAKGYGFGLMNCKGIIDKYHKTSKIFAVCLFSIESELGKGSRFFFRLPKGRIKQFVIAFMLLLSSSYAFADNDSVNYHQTGNRTTSLANNPYIQRARAFADSVYYSNVDGRYNDAIFFADSAIHYLNEYYVQQNGKGTYMLVLNGGIYTPEFDLWQEGFETDYEIILDIRNEVAIAALALLDMSTYEYNNRIYTRLYKFYSQDTSLEDYCLTQIQTIKNTTKAIHSLIFVFVAGIVLFYFTHRYLKRLSKMPEREENKRIEYKDKSVHVQNMILDNCLSTIKHETMYYPSRVLNILQKKDKSQFHDAYELSVYYQDIFTMLSNQASKQLERVYFKRNVTPVLSIFDLFKKIVSDQFQKNIVSCCKCPNDLFVVCDEELMRYFVENLVIIYFDAINEKTSSFDDILLQINFEISEGFVKFAVQDNKIVMSDEEMEQVFYPDNLKYDEANDVLKGTQYLICKQIIREHDEHCGRRGCRIFLEQAKPGLRVVFSLPMAKKSENNKNIDNE